MKAKAKALNWWISCGKIFWLTIEIFLFILLLNNLVILLRIFKFMSMCEKDQTHGKSEICEWDDEFKVYQSLNFKVCDYRQSKLRWERRREIAFNSSSKSVEDETLIKEIKIKNNFRTMTNLSLFAYWTFSFYLFLFLQCAKSLKYTSRAMAVEI